MPLIAISYRRQDSEAITGRIFDRLSTTYGRDAIFRDIDNIPVGADFREHINNVLKNCDLLIVIIGRRWVGKTRAIRGGRLNEELDFVRIEVETALRQNLPIVPVLVGNAEMPPPQELPDSIQALSFRNAIRVDAGQDFENHVSRLRRSIDQLVGEKKRIAAQFETAIPKGWFSTHRVVVSLISASLALASIGLTFYLYREAPFGINEPSRTAVLPTPAKQSIDNLEDFFKERMTKRFCSISLNIQITLAV